MSSGFSTKLALKSLLFILFLVQQNFLFKVFEKINRFEIDKVGNHYIREDGVGDFHALQNNNNFFPEYINESIPRLNQSNYPFRNQPVIDQIGAITENLKEAFYLAAYINGLNFTLRLEKRLIPCRGLALFSQLRVGVSKLNFHKFRHSYIDVISPMCPSNDDPEDTEHYLLMCHSFDKQKAGLLSSVLPVMHSFNICNVSNPSLLQILLYGDKSLPFEENKFILKSTISYILGTEQLTLV